MPEHEIPDSHEFFDDTDYNYELIIAKLKTIKKTDILLNDGVLSFELSEIKEGDI